MTEGNTSLRYQCKAIMLVGLAPFPTNTKLALFFGSICSEEDGNISRGDRAYRASTTLSIS